MYTQSESFERSCVGFFHRSSNGTSREPLNSEKKHRITSPWVFCEPWTTEIATQPLNMDFRMSYIRTTMALYALCLMLLLFSKTTGVTHWKLHDNAIISPVSTELAPGQQDDYMLSNIQIKDPEFAVLLRHSATKGGSKSTGGHRHRGSCPVIVNLGSQPASSSPGGQCNEKPRFPAPRNPDGSGVM